MIYYCCKDITPIKVSISKLLFEEQMKDESNNKNRNSLPIIFLTKSEKNKRDIKNKKKSQNKSTKDFYPPKKTQAKKIFNTYKKENSFERKKSGNSKLIDIVKTKKKNIKNNYNDDEESVKSDKFRKRKSIMDYEAEVETKTKENLFIRQNALNKKLDTLMEIDLSKSKQKLKSNKEKEKEKENKKQNIYDDYELNNMKYDDAYDLDNRSCLKTYWSVIKREHYVIFTFISRNDYNLFYIKIERFFILICTEITMNGMFFVHETMYKKQTGDTSFAQKIPQFVFSLLVTHGIEIILCFLGMTDVHYYEIKALPKEEKNDERIFRILDKLKRKLIAFFIFTFLLFLFHWYFISAFCAVYQNTQVIFLRDCGITILTSLIDPFIIYALTCILRAISLSKCCKKKLCCIYKLSDIIPIF